MTKPKLDPATLRWVYRQLRAMQSTLAIASFGYAVEQLQLAARRRKALSHRRPTKAREASK